MIQFNLLPPVKQEFIKARGLKRLIMVICGFVGGVSLAIFIFLLILVDFSQKHSISSLTKSINSDSSKITAIPNINEVLTVQDQLQALPGLHNAKPAVGRIFSDIAKLTPTSATISDLKLNFSNVGNVASAVGVLPNTMTISGDADVLATVNTFADILKSTTYTVAGNNTTTPKPAFSDVVLTSFNVTQAVQGSPATCQYTLNLSFDPNIFNQTSNVNLTVPNLTTTKTGSSGTTPTFAKSPGQGS